MNWLGASLAAVVFIVLFRITKLTKHSLAVIRQSRRSIEIMLDRHMDEDAKESALKHQAVELFALFGLLIFGSAIALLVPIGLIWMLDLVGLFDLQGVMDVAQRWEFLLGAAIFGIGLYRLLEWQAP